MSNKGKEVSGLDHFYVCEAVEKEVVNWSVPVGAADLRYYGNGSLSLFGGGVGI